MITLLAIFAISFVFWIAFYQIFYTFTLWARDSTATSWCPETFQTFEPLGVIVLSPVLVATVGVVAAARRRAVDAGEDAARRRAGGGRVRRARVAGTIGGNTGRVSPAWLISANS